MNAEQQSNPDSMDGVTFASSHRHEFIAEMAALYHEVDGAIAARNPVCTNRGACCKFGEYGHKLYVTDVELAFFVHGQSSNWKPVGSPHACPYQVEGVCTAREHRPLGCRIFFCDPAAQGWQGPQYERFLDRLKRLGEKHGVAYQYRDWLSALAEVPLPKGATAASANPEIVQVEVDRHPLPVIR